MAKYTIRKDGVILRGYIEECPDCKYFEHAPVEIERTRPCIRCGTCCEKSLCMVGAFVHGELPCPALMREPDGTTSCKYVKQADPDSAIWELLGIGLGCHRERSE